MTQSSSCWNCHQPLKASASQCLWCGVAQVAPPTQFVMAPTAAPLAQAGATPTAASAPHPGPGAAPSAPAAPSPARARRKAVALDDGFAGSAASTGARLAAFTIDVVAVATVAISVALVADSALLTLISVIEMVAFLWVLEARTGVTPGNLVTRLRTSRVEGPLSPGVGRNAVKNVVTGSGFLALVLGAWVVVASSSFDRSGRTRGWADKAARTRSVAVPRRSSVMQSATAVPIPSPQLVTVAATPAPSKRSEAGLAAVQVLPPAQSSTASIEDSASISRTDVPVAGPAAAPLTAQPVAASGIPTAMPAERYEEERAVALLLIFDTGQREEISLPGAGYLGRRPVGEDPQDQLFPVTDPDSSVSKTHVRVEYRDGQLWVTDLGSTNGTDLLGDEGRVIALAANTRTPVDLDYRIRMGNRVFTVSPMLARTDAGRQQ